MEIWAIIMIFFLSICISCLSINTEYRFYHLYEYEFLYTSISPTVEIQNKLVDETWEDGYIPIWRKIKSPAYQNEWFRWKRQFLYLSVLVNNWLQNVNMKNFAIAAKYYQGGVKIATPFEVMVEKMRGLFLDGCG